MKISRNILGLITVVLMFYVVGCSKKEIYEGTYEGIQRSHDKELNDNPGKNNTEIGPPMSYDRYQEERKKLIEKE